MFVSSDRTGDPSAPLLEPFAAMPVELTANRASMDTANRARRASMARHMRYPAGGAEQLVALPDQRERCSAVSACGIWPIRLPGLDAY